MKNALTFKVGQPAGTKPEGEEFANGPNAGNENKTNQSIGSWDPVKGEWRD